MKYKNILKDIVLAFLSQGLSVLSSALLTLFLPKALGVREFGYWQLLIFYMGYAGFFHLGLNDGLYLENGGITRSKIDKKSINSQFVFSLLFQSIISVAVYIAAIVGPFEEQRGFVLMVFSITLLLNNAASFLGYVFQAMNETSLFSFSNAAEALSQFIIIAGLLIAGIKTVEPYLIAYLVAKTLRLAYCLFHARDFIASGLYSPSTTLRLSVNSIQIGIKLMFANIASTLILGTVRFFIDLNWGIEVFSVVSFSISITTLFLTFLSQVSMVFFPNLKQASREQIALAFPIMRDGLDLLLPLIYVLYGPIVIILSLWVPDYAQSLRLFSMLFPICVFDGKMDIVGTTFYKVLREEKRLLNLNVAAFLASAVLTIIGTYVFRSVNLVMVMVVLILGVRSAYSESVIAKKLEVSSSKLGLGAIIISFIFIFIAQVLSPIAASIIYCIVYLVYLFAHKNQVMDLLKMVRKL